MLMDLKSVILEVGEAYGTTLQKSWRKIKPISTAKVQCRMTTLTVMVACAIVSAKFLRIGVVLSLTGDALGSTGSGQSKMTNIAAHRSAKESASQGEGAMGTEIRPLTRGSRSSQMRGFASCRTIPLTKYQPGCIYAMCSCIASCTAATGCTAPHALLATTQPYAVTREIHWVEAPLIICQRSENDITWDDGTDAIRV